MLFVVNSVISMIILYELNENDFSITHVSKNMYSNLKFEESNEEIKKGRNKNELELLFSTKK